MSQKSELGKGLKALLSNINTDDRSKLVSPVASTAVNISSLISINQISANKQQPRNQFEEELLQELAQSIKTYGIIQPITVREINPGQFQIISGERRFRAAQMAGLQEIPCYTRKANDNELLELALVENIQREDLNPIEIAISYQRLMDELNYTHEQLADRVGKKRSTVTNYVRLLKLPSEIQTALKNKTVSMGHARVLAGVENPLQQLQLFKDIQQKDFSVRDAENWLANNKKPPIKSVADATLMTGKSPSSSIKPIEDRLSARLGTKITIHRNQKGEGKIIIPFKNDAQLNDLLDRFEE